MGDSQSQPMSAEDAIIRYVEMRQAMPLKGLGNSVHSIHMGTEYEATLLFADLVALLNSHTRLRERCSAYKGQVEAGAARIAELIQLLGAAASLLGDARSGGVAGSSFDEDWVERKKEFFADWRAVRGPARMEKGHE